LGRFAEIRPRRPRGHLLTQPPLTFAGATKPRGI
jgi:hypothetical protein